MSTRLTNPGPTQSRRPSGETQEDLLGRLFAPVDIASLVFIRVAFGTIMFWEVCRYFIYGWVERYYVQPEFRFTYYGFDWLRLWSGEWMHLHFLFLGVLALMIALGMLYRLSMALFFLGFSYVFLERARWDRSRKRSSASRPVGPSSRLEVILPSPRHRRLEPKG